MCKSSTTGRVTVNLPTEFLTPILVRLSGDDSADEKAAALGWNDYEQKLIDLAKHLRVPMDGPEAVLAILSAMAPLAKVLPGFQFRFVRRAGAKIKKSSAHYLILGVAYEMERQKNPRLTKTAFARMVGAAIVNPDKRRVTRVIQARIDAASAQIRNDNETLNAPALRRFATTVASLIQQELAPDEIAQRLELEAQNIINDLHKN